MTTYIFVTTYYSISPALLCSSFTAMERFNDPISEVCKSGSKVQDQVSWYQEQRPFYLASLCVLESCLRPVLLPLSSFRTEIDPITSDSLR